MKLPPVISLILLSVVWIFRPVNAVSEADEYVFLLPAKGNPYWNVVAQGIDETAHALGAKATIYQGQGDTSGEEQLNTCFTAVQRHPKFLAIAAVSISVGIECLKKTSGAGIKIAEIDSTIPIDEAEKKGVHILFSVGSDSFLIGAKAADFAGTFLPGSDTEVLILEGVVGSSAGTLRANGFKDQLKTVAPRARIVAAVSADWDRLKAMNVTTDVLQRFPNLKLVYAANDLMALGAVEAVKANGKLGQAQVIGVDGIEAARTAVKNGEMLATVAQLPYLIGKRTMELGLDVVSGKVVPQREVTDTPVITRPLLLNKDAPELKYVR